MLLNYLKLAIRLLVRNPFFTFINVMGLAVGFAVFFVLWEYSQRQLTSDQHYKDAERIVRLAVDLTWTDDGKNPGGHLLLATNSSSVVDRITRDFAEIESSVRILHQQFFSKNLTGHGQQVILSYETNDAQPVRFKESKGAYADANLFEFFSIPLVAGERSKLLSERNSIVLSETTAKKYFGNRNPLGKLLLLNGSESLHVSGVFADLPDNTHLAFDFVISNMGRENEWNKALWSGTTCYAKLTNAAWTDVEKKINARLPVYLSDAYKENPQIRIKMILQPLTEVAFEREYQNNNFQAKSKLTLRVLAGVSIAILVMAWVNYINLTISRTSKRIKEIATRKISGAFGRDFIKQFVIETATLNSLAVAFAITLVQFMREPCEIILQITVPEITSVSASTLSFFILVIITGILLTGLYPAVVSGSFNPRHLFIMSSNSSGKRILPSALTTAQYALAIGLIFCALVIDRQLNYLFDKDLGFDKDLVLVVDAPTVRGNNYHTDITSFQNEILKDPYVRNVTFSTAWINLAVKSPDKGVHIHTDCYGIDENYMPLYNLRFLAGRNFNAGERSNGIIVSRFLTERLKFATPEEAIGSKIITSSQDNNWFDMQIIGVIENFKTTPFYASSNNTEAETGRGVSFVYGHEVFKGYVPESIAVKLDVTDLQSSLRKIEQKFGQAFEGNIFTASFLDNMINSAYSNDKLLRNQLAFFTLLAIGVACLGLFGMISNKVVEKKKEIGIRRALGAGLRNIAELLVRTTVSQVLVAVSAGMPVAYILSQNYIERFSERIPIDFWYFILPVMFFSFILLVPVSLMLYKASTSNPVDALRHD